MAEISVIIPVYLTEQYLARCIESVIQQTFQDFELILVDDGSPDKCGEICDQFAQKDHRIKVIHQTNAGVSAARNRGLEIASGDYVVFIDSDDWVDQHYLGALRKSDADFVAHSFSTYRVDGKLLKTQNHNHSRVSVNKERVLTMLSNGVLGYTVCKRFSMDIIRRFRVRFNESINHTEDTLFVLEYLEYAQTAEVESENHYYYIRYNTRDTLSGSSSLDRLAMVCLANSLICAKFFAKDSVEYKKLFYSRVGYTYMSYINVFWLRNLKGPIRMYRFLESLWKNDDVTQIMQYAPDAVWKLSLSDRSICAFQKKNRMYLLLTCICSFLLKGRRSV